MSTPTMNKTQDSAVKPDVFERISNNLEGIQWDGTIASAERIAAWSENDSYEIHRNPGDPDNATYPMPPFVRLGLMPGFGEGDDGETYLTNEFKLTLHCDLTGEEAGKGDVLIKNELGEFEVIDSFNVDKMLKKG